MERSARKTAAGDGVFMDWDPCMPGPWSVVTWVWVRGERVTVQIEPGFHFENDFTRGLILDPVEVAVLG